MSKFSLVREALRTNLDIAVVHSTNEVYLPGSYMGFWNQFIEFHVAPVSNKLCTAEELQKLMWSLVPGETPNIMDPFHEENDELWFGWMGFDEEFGTMKATYEITTADVDMASSNGFVDGKKAITRSFELMRRTIVRLYPDAEIAHDVISGEKRPHIPISELA